MQSIIDSVSNLPTLIFSFFENILTTISNTLGDVWEAITSLPGLILDGIKDIFVPDTAVIEAEFNALLDKLEEKMGIFQYDLDNLFADSMQPGNIEGTFGTTLWSYTGAFVDFRWLIQGVEYFRPIIRGFLVLLMFFYNVRMALSMFGLSSGEIASAAASRRESK